MVSFRIRAVSFRIRVASFRIRVVSFRIRAAPFPVTTPRASATRSTGRWSTPVSLRAARPSEIWRALISCPTRRSRLVRVRCGQHCPHLHMLSCCTQQVNVRILLESTNTRQSGVSYGSAARNVHFLFEQLFPPSQIVFSVVSKCSCVDCGHVRLLCCRQKRCASHRIFRGAI